MAGNYPDAPDHRMALDRDGTQGFMIPTGLPTYQLSSTQMTALNDESSAQVTPQYDTSGLVLVFPELRDVNGYFCTGWGQWGINVAVRTSVDTTNGVDGTWVEFQPSYSIDNSVLISYRTAIRPATQSAVRAIKFFTGNMWTWFSTVHLYGKVTAGQNPNRLEIWDSTLNQRVGPAFFDWGNTPRVTTANKTFRVKNLSPTLSANTVTANIDALTDATPSNVPQETLSADGITFAATASAGTLAPGAISGVLTLRRTTSIDAQTSLWVTRLNASAATWS